MLPLKVIVFLAAIAGIFLFAGSAISAPLDPESVCETKADVRRVIAKTSDARATVKAIDLDAGQSQALFAAAGAAPVPEGVSFLVILTTQRDDIAIHFVFDKDGCAFYSFVIAIDDFVEAFAKAFGTAPPKADFISGPSA